MSRMSRMAYDFAMRCGAAALISAYDLTETDKAAICEAELLFIDFKGQTEYIRDG